MPDIKHVYPVRIYYEDTDAGGIVYHANYLKFCERARTEWLRELNANQSSFLEQNIGLVVRRVEMDNVASASLDDLVIVTSWISELKRASLVFTQQISDQQNKLICAVVVQIACVNLSLAKPCAIPEKILGALKRVS
ncbi:tol-pal system-associated acyl-CoA thioesterase [Colwellia sp. BRX10-4]|jgi:acyl-CoA thioester hydrolase|uniref:tol-pal system-associated acyl-CoA thioesterase n=1 Tax=Colwellia sp. BRX10-4 TaxID=2759843 RepID=UPI0015F5EFD9|nr:tol-pal system-associated acyl-CoA thioesterase [Colwellia sp. BRX10-4]MBA6398633.1 tol-pal system-associated acyl-CoA thioesterase [Colwellia sp. BRX10-4]